MIGTVTLNPSIDQHWRLKGFVKDDANRALNVYETAGGKGINVSKVIAELGGSTLAFSFLGGSTGALLRDLARPLGFPIVSLEVSGSTRMNVIMDDILDNTHTRFSAPGPALSRKDVNRLAKKLLAVSPKPSFWVFGGSPPLGLHDSVYRELIKMLQKRGFRCVLDADNEALRLGIGAKPYLIKPNEFEMQRLSGKKLTTINEYFSEALKIVHKGVEWVVVSMAARGAIFVSLRKSFYLSAPRVKVVNSLGAGDALIAGFIYGLEKGMDLELAAKNGIAASISTVMRESPRLCLKKDLPKLIKCITLKELRP